MHGKTYRRHGIQELSEPAYTKDIVHPLARFDEKMTPLSRGYVPPGGWEKEFLDTLVPAIGQQGVVPRDASGYTQIDLALRIAGFHNAMATNCHTGNWTRPRLSDDLGCFYDWEGIWSPGTIGLPLEPPKLPVASPAEMSEIVKDAALFLGAGLGQLARLGTLITPEFGPRVRLCKVLTDLPLKPTDPIVISVLMCVRLTSGRGSAMTWFAGL
jgi:hypothetical protein